MGLDGVTLKCLCHELRSLIGAVVRQVYGPRPETLALHLWQGEALTLLIAPAEGRLHLTTQRLPNPAEPSPFVMLLRKHLKGGRITAVEQPGLERLVRLMIQRGEGRYELICELFGRGNIVLVRDGVILGGLHQGREGRQILPHQPYLPPPSQGKLDPSSLSEADLAALLREGELWQALVRRIDGLGPRLAKELAIRAGLEPDRPSSQLSNEECAHLLEVLSALLTQVNEGQLEPLIYFDGDRPVQATPFPLKLYGHLRGEPRASLSQALDEHSFASGAQAAFSEEQARLLKLVREGIERLERAIAKVKEDRAKAEDYERYRRLGELVLANLAGLERGQREAELLNPLTGRKERIALDPQLDPAENAQALFKRYKKLKRGAEKLRERERELEEELEQLRALELGLEQAEGLEDLQEVTAELEAAGYIRTEAGSKLAPSAPGPAGPREFLVDGFRVLVGRSGRENDRLVREAHREDIWLHARGLSGAHVLIKSAGRKVPQAVLERAARLAAYYSKGRSATKVPVTYTQVKYLRKPRGARPGAVLVQHEEGTLLVSPRLED